MRPRQVAAAVLFLGGIALPSVLAAQTVAYTAPGTTNMRAGPRVDFPVIARVLGGSSVTVFGCLSDYSWCDSSVQGVRGWISSTHLEFLYGSHRVPVPQYYAYFRVPLVDFDLGYWDRHYRDRSFYRSRDRWRDRDRQRAQGGGVYIDPDQSRNAVGVYIDPDQSRDGRGRDSGRGRSGRVFGKVTDRPGYCYVLGRDGSSVIARCP